MPSSRQEVGVGLAAGKIYVVGGFDATGQSVNKVERYDPETGLWEDVIPLPAPEPLNHVGVATVDGKLYVIGGLRQNFSAVDSVYCFDPDTEEWSQKTSLPEPRGATGVAVVRGQIYVAGGLPSFRGTRFTAYDPVSDTWTELPDMPTARDHLASVALGGRFYAMSGRSRGVLQSAAEAYHPGTGLWSTVAPIPTPRGGIAAAVAGGRAYVFGGEGNPEPGSGGVFQDVEEYDPSTDSWRAMAELPRGRHGIGAASYQGRIFIPGGGLIEGLGATDRQDAFSPPGLTVVTFDGAPFFGPLTDEFAGIDWGAFGWFSLGRASASCQGPLALSPLSPNTFGFPQPAILDSFDVTLSSGDGKLLVVSVDGSRKPLEFVRGFADHNSCRTIHTGFTQPAASIFFLSEDVPFLIDGVTYK